MFIRRHQVHSVFESLQAAVLIQRLAVHGRPAHFVTNEQITAQGFGRMTGRPPRPMDGPFECR
nr:hypothetical protein [uncultured Gellertiella sp.]